MDPWNELQSEVIACQRCSRLLAHCQKIAIEKRKAYLDDQYWGKPVPDFGRDPAKILIVGLAPGAHGANRTGRMFTGDRSGQWLYRSLFNNGLANRPDSVWHDDDLRLKGCVITNICRCAPPDNKPTTEEVNNCQPFFKRTIDLVRPVVFVALGQLAWRSILLESIERDWLPNPSPRPKFGHGEIVKLTDGRSLIGSYHPSQQNTFTGRLTETMLDSVFEQAKKLSNPARKHR